MRKQRFVLIKFCISKIIGTYNLSHVFQGLGSCRGRVVQRVVMKRATG
jgi:hypothetical protein